MLLWKSAARRVVVANNWPDTTSSGRRRDNRDTENQVVVSLSLCSRSGNITFAHGRDQTSCQSKTAEACTKIWLDRAYSPTYSPQGGRGHTHSRLLHNPAFQTGPRELISNAITVGALKRSPAKEIDVLDREKSHCAFTSRRAISFDQETPAAKWSAHPRAQAK